MKMKASGNLHKYFYLCANPIKLTCIFYVILQCYSYAFLTHQKDFPFYFESQAYYRKVFFYVILPYFEFYRIDTLSLNSPEQRMTSLARMRIEKRFQ